MNLQILVNQIKELALSKGTTVNKVLTNSGAGKDFVYNIRKGQIPSIEKIQKIAEYFGVSTDYLLTGKEKSPDISGDKISERAILLARKLGEVPEDKQEAALKFIESTLDTFLEAIKDEDGNR